MAKNGNKAGGKGKGEGAPLGAITHDGPVTRGFDEFFGFHHARMIKSVFENDRVTEIIEPVDMLPRLTQRATQHIAERAKAGQAFFLYLPLNSPHTPIVPSQEWRGKSGLGDYADFVMETDWAIGEVPRPAHTLGQCGNIGGCAFAGFRVHLRSIRIVIACYGVKLMPRSDVILHAARNDAGLKR